MKILSQRDPKWSADKLGSSSLTLGRFGCTTTSVSMLTDYFGEWMTPKQMAHDVNWYTKDGLILWKNLHFKNMKFDRREYGRNDYDIQAALKDPDRAVILEGNNHSQWVTALRKTLIGKSYVVADPWLGTKVDVLKVYKNITGAAYFSRV